MFHTNQILAGNAILDHFRSGASRYVLLQAPMQSGKSGTFNWVAREMMSEGLIQTCFILCGSAETVLKRQAEQDRKAYGNPWIRVYFRGDFPRLIKEPKNLFHDSLVIIDESHLDQDRGQQMDTLLTHFNLDLRGDPEPLRRTNTYILSVSATPYSEYSAIVHGQNGDWKRVVHLEPGDGYRGVEWFYERNHILSTFDIQRHPRDFVRLVRAQGLKYNILRLAEGGEIYAFIATLAEKHGFDLFYYNSRVKTVFLSRDERSATRGATPDMPTLEDEPSKPAIVLIKGTLRSGKVLPKEHIGFVWEDSQDPASDAILQSLLGRVCGYHTYAIDIYVSDRFLYGGEGEVPEIERYMGEEMIPTRARNLVAPPALERNYLTHFTPPFLYVPDEPTIVSRKSQHDWLQTIFSEQYDNILRMDPEYSDRIEDLIERSQEETIVSYRTFNGRSYPGYKEELDKLSQQRIPCRDIEFKDKEITVFICSYPLDDPRARWNGQTYIVFRMDRTEEAIQRIQRDQFYPLVSSQTIFY